jgi:hypothetical protein
MACWTKAQRPNTPADIQAWKAAHPAHGSPILSRTNPLDYLPQINQRSLVSKRNLQSDTVRFLNDSLDLCLDNSAAVHDLPRRSTIVTSSDSRIDI